MIICITKKLVLKLHELVAKNTLEKDAEDHLGIYRSVQVFIRGVEWLPSEPKDISQDMRKLFFWHTRL